MMLIKSSFVVGSCSVPLPAEAKDIVSARTYVSSETTRFASVVCCSSRTNNAYSSPLAVLSSNVPLKNPPLIEKSENEFAGAFSLLLFIYLFNFYFLVWVFVWFLYRILFNTQGDDSYSCWKAYFELKDLKRVLLKEDVEKLILQSGGVKSLIGCLHGVSSIHKGKTNGFALEKPLGSEGVGNRQCPVPYGLPKKLEELAEEERGRLPDSPYTRLLRTKGRFPAWYSPAPDHETD